MSASLVVNYGFVLRPVILKTVYIKIQFEHWLLIVYSHKLEALVVWRERRSPIGCENSPLIAISHIEVYLFNLPALNFKVRILKCITVGGRFNR